MRCQFKKLYILQNIFFVCLIVCAPFSAEGNTLRSRCFILAPEKKALFPCKKAPLLKGVNFSAPKGGSAKILARDYSFDSLNPYSEKGNSAEGIEATFATLMGGSLDQKGVLYPYIIESYISSNDGRVLELHLREKAFFHNGELISSEDLKFTILLLKEKGGARYKETASHIQSMTIVSDQIIRIEFDRADKRLIYQFLKFPVFSRNDPEIQNFSSTKRGLLGSGPYNLQHSSQSKVSYKRQKNWWGEALEINKGRYNFDELSFLYFKNFYTALQSFTKGGYDIRRELRAKAWENAYRFPAVEKGLVKKEKFMRENLSGLYAIFLNTRRYPLNILEVRKALNLVFDFEWLNKTRFYNFYKRIYTIFINIPLFEQVTNFFIKPEVEILQNFFKKGRLDALLTEIERHAEEGLKNTSKREKQKYALKLLQKAGFFIKNGKLYDAKNKRPVELEFLTAKSGMKNLLIPFKTDLKKIGIELKIKTLSSPAYWERIGRYDYDMISRFLDPITSLGADQRRYWSCKNLTKKWGENYAGVCDKDIEVILDNIFKESSSSTLKVLAKLLDRLLFSRYYFIPMWYTDDIYIAYWKGLEFPDHWLSGVQFYTWWRKDSE